MKQKRSAWTAYHKKEREEMEYAVDTNLLTKKFGQHTAVNQINLHVKKGEIYGFIGRNGA